MRLAIHIPIWKRPELTTRVLAYYQQFDAEIVVIGSEGDVSREMAGDHHYVEAPNEPLSAKFNAGMRYCRDLDVDGVLCVGSDDIITPALWKWVSEDEDDIRGVLDSYLVSMVEKKAYYWSGYEGPREGETVGAGRRLSRSLLDRLDWSPWRGDLDRGCDSGMSEKLRKLDVTVRAAHMAEAGAIACLKTNENLNLIDAHDNLTPVHFDRLMKEFRGWK